VLPRAVSSAFVVQDDICDGCSARGGGVPLHNLHVVVPDLTALPAGVLAVNEYAGCVLCDETMLELQQVNLIVCLFGWLLVGLFVCLFV
jgi:hypothetical protein